MKNRILLTLFALSAVLSSYAPVEETPAPCVGKGVVVLQSGLTQSVIPYGMNIPFQTSFVSGATTFAPAVATLDITLLSQNTCVKVFRDDVEIAELCGANSITQFNVTLPDCLPQYSGVASNVKFVNENNKKPALIRVRLASVTVSGNTVSPTLNQHWFSVE